MPECLKIAQVSDIHIGALERDLEYSGFAPVEPRRQFRRTLQSVREYAPDLLVLSGDLAATYGEPEAYAWLAETLADCDIPYEVMAGNHDLVPGLSQAFELPSTDLHESLLYFKRTLKGHTLLFLDTASYTLDATQLQWLRRQASGSGPVLLFMHHPPILCGSHFMDQKHSLTNTEETWRLITSLPTIRHIFCGHYHTERVINLHGRWVYLTPSTLMQINPHREGFAVEHTRPGWRYIEWDGFHLNSEVIYC